MDGQPLLLAGCGCLALALAVPVALWRSPGATGGVAKSLAALDRVTLVRTRDGVDDSEPDAESGTSLMKTFGDLSNLAPTGYRARIQELLDKAGNPTGWSLHRLFGYKVLAALGVAAFGALVGMHSPLRFVVCALFGAIIGFLLPDLLVYNNGIKRQEKIQKSLPDALDMLTVSVEAGLGFDAALSQVARNTEGPIAGEFYRVLQEMQIGKSRTDALRGLGERTTVMDMRTFASAIVQADYLGIPIANVLREQAKEMRLKRHQRAEEQAQKVTVKIMFPVVLCILPSLFVIVIGPGAINIMHAFSQRG
jgi:tight adherence protein C